MPENTCELVRLAAMAARDGEAPALPAEQMAKHLRDCPQCREQVEQLQDLAGLLDGQRRLVPAADLRPRILAALERQTDRRRLGYALPALAIALLACRAISQASGAEISLAIQVVPLVLAAATFAWLKTNPFAVSADLEPQGADL